MKKCPSCGELKTSDSDDGYAQSLELTISDLRRELERVHHAVGYNVALIDPETGEDATASQRVEWLKSGLEAKLEHAEAEAAKLPRGIAPGEQPTPAS